MTDDLDWMKSATDDASKPKIDLHADVAHPARVYDYALGGKDNFAVDRAAAAEVAKHSPHMPAAVQANRNFMVRAIRYLAQDHGFRQFLDIGTGLPTSPNLHEVAQQVAPESRIVYVDNDPIVLVHARALLTSSPEGHTAYLDADLHEPDTIINAPELRDTLDFNKPMVLCLFAILHFITADQEAYDIVDRLLRALPSGSALALSHSTVDHASEDVLNGLAAYQASGMAIKPRTKAQVERFFDGLNMISPGTTLVHQWHPDENAQSVADAQVYTYGGVAIKC